MPNQIPVLQCNFLESCNHHDDCYAQCENSVEGACEYRRCRPGGDLFKDIRCDTDVKLMKLYGDAMRRKKSCDVSFYTSMVQQNAGWACRAFAIVYTKAVKDFGDGAFNGLNAMQNTPALKQGEQEYNHALDEFFRSANETEFQEFVRTQEARDGEVKLCGRIIYTKAAGLQNVPEDRSIKCPN